MAAAHLPSDTREGQSTNSKASSDCLLVDKLNRQLFWVYMARLGGGGAEGLSSESRAQQLPHVSSEPAPDSLKRDLLLARQ